MRLTKNIFRLVWVACAVALLGGCASIPERELENAFKYQRLMRNDQEVVQPIKSEYQTLASKAWKNMEAGRTGQYVGILELGDDALMARIHLIRAARSTIIGSEARLNSSKLCKHETVRLS
jgi:hypothetical protein